MTNPAQQPPPIRTKQFVVKFANGNRGEMCEAIPGLTVRELFQTLNLTDDYVLSKGDTQQTFNLNDPLYPAIEDGDVLYISAQVKVGITSFI